MTIRRDKKKKQADDLNIRNPYTSFIIAVLNVLLLAIAVILYCCYTDEYRVRLREENLGNIANLNQAAAISATALMNSWDVKLDDLIQFVSRKDYDYQEAMEVIYESNSNSDRYFELLKSDYSGYLIQKDENGAFFPLSYEKSSYAELQRTIDDVDADRYGEICFTPEFTDQKTALKYFAIYRHLQLKNEEGDREVYTLLLASKSEDVLKTFNNQSGYEGQSNVLINDKGDYIVSSEDFKSANFFQYLYVYNDLTLDEQNLIAKELQQRDSGNFYYKNAKGQECVFRYMRMPMHNWYCVTSVPVESFRAPVQSINYTVHVILVLLTLMIIDVVWLNSMNRRLRLSTQRAKEAGDAKTDFLSRMSHDIRTPLNGIIGLTTLAQDEDNPPHTDEYLENIRVSGQFLMGLVNDILDMNKVESGKIELSPEPYAAEEFANYIEAVVVPLCDEKGLEFRMTTPGDDTPLLLDHLRFNQIFFNLLSNGVKYTPKGGLLELYWEYQTLDSEHAALDFIIRDNGIGMSEEFQKHMFDSFTQEHAQTASTGTGLGLAIVKGLVNLMNGQIQVESKKGTGTTIRVHLEAEVCETVSVASENTHETDLRGRKVLLCEDNKTNIFFMQRLFEKWELHADIAENGRIGLEKFMASEIGYYDVILMDVMMPEMDGLEATRQIRKLERPDAAVIPIIAMTANAYDTDVQNCLDAGMNMHMSKPIDQEKLKTALAGIIV